MFGYFYICVGYNYFYFIYKYYVNLFLISNVCYIKSIYWVFFVFFFIIIICKIFNFYYVLKEKNQLQKIKEMKNELILYFKIIGFFKNCI